MKWNDVAIILLDPADKVIRDAAYAWRGRYEIPTARCFSARYPKTHALAGRVPLGFAALAPDSLSFSSLGTKIILVSHGLPGGVAVQGAIRDGAEVAGFLAACGLREVGLLAFKGCLLGKGAFLKALRLHLSNRAIGVGWLIGYKDVSRTSTLVWDCATYSRTHAYESIGSLDFRIRTACSGADKLPDDARVTVVRGNRFVLPPKGRSTRYTVHATQV